VKIDHHGRYITLKTLHPIKPNTFLKSNLNNFYLFFLPTYTYAKSYIYKRKSYINSNSTFQEVIGILAVWGQTKQKQKKLASFSILGGWSEGLC